MKVVSGELEVGSQPLDLFSKKILHFTLKGSNIRGELLGEWAERQGIQHFQLDRFYAQLGFDSQGLREISVLEASSPEFQFQIKPSEK